MASVKPEINKAHDLGTTTHKWGVVHTGDVQTETLTTTGDVEIGGNLIVQGSSAVANVSTIEVEDPLIKLAKGNSSDLIDIGFYAPVTTGSTISYVGIFRDASTGAFRVFEGASEEPTTTVGDHQLATLQANIVGQIEGVAAESTALETARHINLSGDVTGQTTQAFDGTADVTIAATLAYTAPVGSNYIDGATTYANADDLLDAQIKVVADDLASEVTRATGAEGDLQTEIDATQGGAGLGTDGAYTAPVSSNYLGAATSLKSADSLLDAQVKVVADDLASEVTRASGAESALQSEIDATQSGAGLGTDGAYSAPVGSNYLGAATSLKSADSLLDSQVKVVADDLASEITRATGAEGDIQTELDATQSGAGLDADGSYSAPVGSNYLGAAVSLKDADSALDSAIKSISDAVDSITSGSGSSLSSLQTELDDTQAGAGLGTDGTYSAPVGSNYLGSATSLKSADSLLDAQVKVVADDLASEVTRATGIEGSLQTEIDATQDGAGLGADGSYTANGASNYISTAISLKDADNKLDAQVKTNADGLASEISRASGVESGLQTELDATQSGAGLGTDGGYSAPVGSNYLTSATSLKSADSLLDGQIKTIEDDLASEVTRATGAEADLQSEIDATQGGAGLGTDGAYTAPVSSNYLGAATSLKSADSLLDAQVKVVADDLASEVTRATGAESALQSEIDATQSGAGLGTDGSYTAPVGSNYLGSATSLKSADNLLDAQVKTVADGLASEITRATGAEGDLQTEIDATQGGAGLGTDGTYTAPVGSNYLGSATSLKSADSFLDAQVKVVADGLASEVTRATGAEADLQTEIDATQSGAGLDADGAYSAPVSSNYLSAATSLKSADSLLDAQVKTVADGLASEITRATGAEGDLQAEIDATQSGAGLGTDGAYSAPVSSNYLSAATSLKSADSLLDSQVKTVADGLASEITRATGAEGDLQSELDATQSGAGLDADGAYSAPVGSNYLSLSTSLKNADSLLDAQTKTVADGLASEIARASGVESGLQTELDATQSGAGLGADGSYTAFVGSNYLGAATSLKSADGLLDTQIKTVADGLASEITRASGVESGLQTELDATQSGAGLGTDGSYTANGASNYLSGASSLKDADDHLDTQIKTVADDLASEVTRASGVESGLQTEINDTQSGAGLGADGSYTAPLVSNYLSGATSLKSADSLLDTQIKSVSDRTATLEAAPTTVTLSGGTNGSGSDAVALGETLTINGTANEVNVSVGANSLTIGLVDNVEVTSVTANNLTATGSLSVAGGASVGSLTVSGAILNANSASVVSFGDAMLQLGSNSPSNKDHGWFSQRTDGQYVGGVYDDSASEFIFFETASLPTNTVNVSAATFSLASVKMGALTASDLAFPTTDGSAGQFITTDGAGALSFTSGFSKAYQILTASGSLTAGSEDELTVILTASSDAVVELPALTSVSDGYKVSVRNNANASGVYSVDVAASTSDTIFDSYAAQTATSTTLYASATLSFVVLTDGATKKWYRI